MSTTVDAVVLELHDGSSAEGTVGLQVPGKGRHSRHENNDPEVLSFLVGSHDPVNDGFANLVVDGMLFVANGSNEELDPIRAIVHGQTWMQSAYLILDVDKMLGIRDGRDVRIRDGMLRLHAMRPFRAAEISLAS